MTLVDELASCGECGHPRDVHVPDGSQWCEFLIEDAYGLDEGATLWCECPGFKEPQP